ncbi:MAG: hypothetical protein POELPBGB_01885 [Bacteroidia bacterium]|nr:hypothetical protein [Bacteroidia bacterium]
MKNLLGLSILIAIILTACQSNETGSSKDVAQDQIYRKYEVSIDEATATATASAVFRFAGENGTTLTLTSPAKITANGVDLTQGRLLFGGAYYRNEAPLGCPANKVELVYTDKDGIILTDLFEAGKATFQQQQDSFHLGKTLSIPFSFSGTDPVDNFEILIRDKEKRSLSFYAESNTDKFFQIPGTATDTLAKGELELQIISHKRKNLDNHSTLGGTADFSCYYKPVKVVAVKEEVN